MKLSRDKLYDILLKLCDSGYSLGLHGVNKRDKKKISETIIKAQEIMDNGLKNQYFDFFRKVYAFGRIEAEDNKDNIKKALKNYEFSNSIVFMLIVIPRYLKKSNGESLYIGSPNEKLYHDLDFDINNHERVTMTTFADKCMQSEIPESFVLGSYRVIDNENVNLSLNKNHICFNEGLVSDEYFDNISKNIKEYCEPIDFTFFKGEVPDELEKILKLNEKDKYKYLAVTETARQYEEEKQIVKVNDEVISNDYIMEILKTPDTIEEYNEDIKKSKENKEYIVTSSDIAKTSKIYEVGNRVIQEFKNIIEKVKDMWR